MTSMATFRAATGYRPIDSVRYLQRPTIDPHFHAETDIYLYRLASSGQAGSITTAERTGDEPDLLFMSRGAGVPAFGHVGGARFKLAANRAHRATFVPRGIDTSVTFGVSAYSTNLMFPAGYLSSLVAEQRPHEFQPVVFAEDERLFQLIRMLDAEISAPGFASRLMVDGLTRSLAALLGRVDLRKTRSEADRVYLSPAKLRRVIAFIDAHLDEEITLADLAKIADLSVFHFARVFKRATGSSPYHYVRERRLDLSRQLLADGQLPICELALACGFSNQSHFTSAFSRAMGMSPGRYRLLIRQ
ncbi:MAG: AraC family transcriptional regulator [Sphingomonas sp.]|nr:AraC family transcriptional regulator [Sphingomonas sp.]